MEGHKEIVLITGGGGFIGQALVRRLAEKYNVASLDRRKPKELPAGAESVHIDLTSDDSVQDALRQVRETYGQRIASVIHLAAYFDLSGEPDPMYEEVTVKGTERLLRGLQAFDVEQFVFSSTMLVHAPGKPGQTINEKRALDPKLPYRASKIQAEEVIHDTRGNIPVVYLRPAGVYDDKCSNPFLAHQIARIYLRSAKSHVYPGDLNTGQSFLHLDDLSDAVSKLVEQRRELPEELPLLLGEPKVLGYGELQDRLGQLIHGHKWETREVPKTLAKTGAWMEDEVLEEDSFIKPWMVDIADDHYALDIGQARKVLSWEPKHSLSDTLPEIVYALTEDPPAWFQANRLNPAFVATNEARPPEPPDPDEMKEHMQMMGQMHLGKLWVHFLNIALGLWLLASPFALGLFDPETAQHFVRDVTAERNLPPPEVRNTMMGVSDIISGLLIVIFSTLSLSRRFSWAQWGNTAVGIWLLFAPLIFWAPTAAAYNNDTLVGALVIAFAILVPMMPGMSHEGMMQKEDVPPGWSYCPSTYLQRLPIIALGLFGFLIARQLAAYQMGHAGGVLEPFFVGEGKLNGSEQIITSEVSKAWPVADGGLGAVSYMFEVLMGVMGSSRRWRTMPWMVALFGMVVVPLGVVSIYFIIIQPIVIGTYCTLCLATALAMLIMIPFALDELVAMGQFLRYRHRAGKPFWRSFLQGGAMPGATERERLGFDAELREQLAHSAWGITIPWTLLVSALLGLWLMFTRITFGTEGAMADSDHLVGALVITTAVMAMAEVARPMRFINVAFGVWLIVAPWMLEGATALASWAGVAVGIALIVLSLPRGKRSQRHYGTWDRYIV